MEKVKIRTVLFCIVVFIGSSCNIKNCNAGNVAPELTNEVLRENIIEYVKENYHRIKMFLEPRNLISLSSSLSGDTIVYKIYYIATVGNLFFHNVSSIFKVDSIYIGYRDLSANSVGVSEKAIVDILSDDYPSLKDDYELYLKQKERKKPIKKRQMKMYLVLTPFSEFLTHFDEWTLKFVDGVLVYRRVDGVRTRREEFF